jgi:hypothetical protein
VVLGDFCLPPSLHHHHTCTPTPPPFFPLSLPLPLTSTPFVPPRWLTPALARHLQLPPATATQPPHVIAFPGREGFCSQPALAGLRCWAVVGWWGGWQRSRPSRVRGRQQVCAGVEKGGREGPGRSQGLGEEVGRCAVHCSLATRWHLRYEVVGAGWQVALGPSPEQPV